LKNTCQKEKYRVEKNIKRERNFYNFDLWRPKVVTGTEKVENSIQESRKSFRICSSIYSFFGRKSKNKPKLTMKKLAPTPGESPTSKN